MTKHLHLVGLTELATIRLVCSWAGCGTAVEIPVSQLRNGVDSGCCPTCKRKFTAGYDHDEKPLQQLAEAIDKLRALQINFQVQFIVDDLEEKS